MRRQKTDKIPVNVVYVTLRYCHCIQLSLSSIVTVRHCHWRLMSPEVPFTKCFLSLYDRVTIPLSPDVWIPIRQNWEKNMYKILVFGRGFSARSLSPIWGFWKSPRARRAAQGDFQNTRTGVGDLGKIHDHKPEFCTYFFLNHASIYPITLHLYMDEYYCTKKICRLTLK